MITSALRGESAPGNRGEPMATLSNYRQRVPLHSAQVIALHCNDGRLLLFFFFNSFVVLYVIQTRQRNATINVKNWPPDRQLYPAECNSNNNTQHPFFLLLLLL